MANHALVMQYGKQLDQVRKLLDDITKTLRWESEANDCHWQPKTPSEKKAVRMWSSNIRSKLRLIGMNATYASNYIDELLGEPLLSDQDCPVHGE